MVLGSEVQRFRPKIGLVGDSGRRKCESRLKRDLKSAEVESSSGGL